MILLLIFKLDVAKEGARLEDRRIQQLLLFRWSVVIQKTIELRCSALGEQSAVEYK